MVLASQLRAGMAVEFESQKYRVVAADYHPGQGKMGGVTHARLQNIDTGTFREMSLRAELKLQDLAVERQSLEFLYADGDQCCFMNPENYEQTEVAKAIVGPRAVFLEAGMKVPVEFVSGRPVYVLFPDMIEVKIADTAPAMHQQVDSAFKPAKLPNGLEVMVPQFIKAGDMIRLDLENMRYVDRARGDTRAKHA
jgi:elongation factor P